MQNFKLSISYDGSKFYGSQIQKSEITIAGEITKAIEKSLSVKTHLLFASRTDRGVHARENVCSFSSTTKIPVPALRKAINSKLNKYIHITKLSKAGTGFNPRYGCKSKIYRYYVRVSSYYPYMRDYCWNVRHPLNIKNMEKAAAILPGQKDFRHLSSCSDRTNTVCNIISCRISKGKTEFYINVEAEHFLYKMVRTIAGFIIGAGKGDINVSDFNKILCGRHRHISPAPPGGLYLWRVKY